ncbi:MAG: MBL fold metallo-hydrolase [Anaerolineales bacterium]|nr:MBL fold metallo-hydrolase [Anaerolineales bacterium]
MASAVQTIHLRMPFNLGAVNCFLIKGKNGFVLIDTGTSNNQGKVEKALSDAGCHPGGLKLILLTHGDFDHAGNAAYLRKVYQTSIAMHAADSGMVEWGNMFASRKKANGFIGFLATLIFGFGRAKRFKPDLLVDEDFDLYAYGVEAQIIHIPGHSGGSIGILNPEGELICGDLFENVKTPALHSIIDDLKKANASIEKLMEYKIKNVLPGHGDAFKWEEFINTWER